MEHCMRGACLLKRIRCGGGRGLQNRRMPNLFYIEAQVEITLGLWYNSNIRTPLNLPCPRCGKILLRFLKSTRAAVYVVPFIFCLCYNEDNKRGGYKMNTDKIYAEAIANEYSVKTASKVVALKKLDRKVKLAPTVFTYTFGIIAALILGVGMCFSMGVLGSGGTTEMVIGVIVGIIGIAGASVNYPIYKKILESRKAKYAGDIIALAKEITDKE